MRWAPLLLATTLVLACNTGVDKDRPGPEPAVGRSFGTDSERSDSATQEASHPIRNLRSDPTGTPGSDSVPR